MSTNCSNLIKTPLVPVASIATMASSTHHNHNHTTQKQTQQHPITTTKMGSRRIFSAQFKLQVLDSYRMDSDCKGNQRATARKYGIHRRQIQKWLQNETNLRSSVNNNNELQNHNKSSAIHTMNGGATISNSRTTNNLSLSGVDNVNANKHLLHENASATNKSINQSAVSGSQPTNFNFAKNHSPNATTYQLQSNHPQRHSTNELSLDITRHSVAANARNHHEPSIELSYNTANDSYKCASNATPSTNTSFSVSSISAASSSSSSTLAPSSFVARPLPHSLNESSVSYATQRQTLRIVSPSYLMPSPQSNASHTTNGVPILSNHQNNHYPNAYHPSAFEINSLIYDVPTSIGMIPSIRHCLGGTHEYPVAIPTFAPRAMPSAFESPFHLQPPSGFYEHSSNNPYDLYRTPAYVPSIAIPTPIIPELKVEKEAARSNDLPSKSQSPIDLTLPDRHIHNMEESNRVTKPRFSLPSPPVKVAFKALDIPNADGNETEMNVKPWDLSCSRKRKSEDDIDEGIGIKLEENASSNSNAKSKSSPTPAKVVKLFKPYLLSSDDEEDEQNGKKCPTSEQQHKDPIIWSSHSFCENTSSVALTPFQSPVSNVNESQQNTSVCQPSSYWLNHGSPVSGYDSASSTFSDCNCNDSTCQTKLASPAPTVASFTDEFTSSSSNVVSSEIHSEIQQSTKYMIPRRHILEKWSHEDDEFTNQFNRSQQELISVR